MIRPSVLWGDGKSLKKRRPGRRSSVGDEDEGEEGKKRRKVGEGDVGAGEADESGERIDEEVDMGAGLDVDQAHTDEGIAVAPESLAEGDQALFTIE